MSGWDLGLDFDPDDSFISMDNSNFSFEQSIDPLESLNDTMYIGTETINPEPPTEIFTPIAPIIPIQQLSKSSNNYEDLAQENCKLREYFASLKDRAEKATSENQQLKEQLGKWREGFKSAMFSGMGIKKQ